VYFPGSKWVDRRDRKLQWLAGHRLPSSDLIFRQHREEALVRRYVLAAGRLARPRSVNQESSIITMKTAQKGAHLPSELRLHRPGVSDRRGQGDDKVVNCGSRANVRVRHENELVPDQVYVAAAASNTVD